ncbi:MAG: TonB-dependent siderophore receptor, partial [Nostoc sp.]
MSGPLNDSKTVLYRLNTSYRDSGSFINFGGTKLFVAAPVVSWEISKNTKLTFEGEFVDGEYRSGVGIPAAGTVLFNPNGKLSPSLNIGEPTDSSYQNLVKVGYTLEQRFSDNWSLKNAFRASYLD